ncbi:hypothetical protein ABH945_002142 [Paraburkholderia sp. GAS333]
MQIQTQDCYRSSRPHLCHEYNRSTLRNILEGLSRSRPKRNLGRKRDHIAFVSRRTGRGVLLSRAKRHAVWPVFDEYRGQLASRKLKEVDDAYRELASMLDGDKSLIPSYRAIVIDETQDFGRQ